MKKTTNFFVIDNYNTVPVNLIDYCEDYIIYDSSTDEKIVEELEQSGLKYKRIARAGHSINAHFRYFQEYYDELPDVICMLKGHMIGRHCSQDFFERVYDNKYFTYLYEDKKAREGMNESVAFLATENKYLEINNSWYVKAPEMPHKYFVSFNDLLQFIYTDPILPKYCLFSPGACYILRKEQVLKHSKMFYHNLNKIMTYGMNPSYPVEAQIVERMLPIIFDSNYRENDWMNDSRAFDEKLQTVHYKVEEFDEMLRYHNLSKAQKIGYALKKIGNVRTTYL